MRIIFPEKNYISCERELREENVIITIFLLALLAFKLCASCLACIITLIHFFER